jgi:hypothetical protein
MQNSSLLVTLMVLRKVAFEHGLSYFFLKWQLNKIRIERVPCNLDTGQTIIQKISMLYSKVALKRWKSTLESFEMVAKRDVLCLKEIWISIIMGKDEPQGTTTKDHNKMLCTTWSTCPCQTQINRDNVCQKLSTLDDYSLLNHMLSFSVTKVKHHTIKPCNLSTYLFSYETDKFCR